MGNARDTYGSSAYTEWFRNPLTSWMTATLWLITGESVYWARMLSVIAGATSIILIYAFAKKYTSHPIVPAMLFAMNEQFLFWSGTAYTEIISLALIIGGAYAYEQENMRATMAAGFLLGASYLARFANAIIIGVNGLTLIVRKEWRRVVAFTLGGIPLFALWVGHNLARNGVPFWDAIEQSKVIDAYTTAQPLLPFLNTVLWTLLPLLTIILTGMFFGKGARPRNYGIWLLSALIFLVLHIFIIRLKLPRYSLALLPFLILLVIYELPRFETKKHGQIIIIAAIVLAAVIGPISAFTERTEKMYCGERIDEMLTQLPDDANVIGSNSWVHYGYHRNVTAYALYTDDWRQFEAEAQPEYIIYDTLGGLDFPRELLNTWAEEGYMTEITQAEGPCGQVTLWRVRRE